MRNLLSIITFLVVLALVYTTDKKTTNNVTKLEHQIHNERNFSINAAIFIKYKLQNITERLNLINQKSAILKFKLKSTNLNQKKKIFDLKANITIIRKKVSNLIAHINSLKKTMIKLKKLMNKSEISTQITSYYQRIEKIIAKIFNLEEELLQLKSQNKILKTKVSIARNEREINKLKIKSQLNRLNLRKTYLTKIQKILEIKQENTQNA